MNKKTYLLICLAEEAAEVMKAATKALRFGLDDGQPGGFATNAQDIARELNDLMAVAEMLEECEAIRWLGKAPYMIEDVKAKKARVAVYMQRALGAA